MDKTVLGEGISSSLVFFFLVFTSFLFLFFSTQSVDAFIWNRPTTLNALLNSSSFANSSNYWDSLDTPADILLSDLTASSLDITGYTLTTSYLAGVVGTIDMRADPWYLSGTDLQLAQDLDVLGNISSTHYCNSTNCYTIADFLLDTGTGGGNDSWAGNYTFYYNKSQVDNNFSLYYLSTIINSMLTGNLTEAKTYANTNILGNASSSDTWLLNFTDYINTTIITNNFLKINGSNANQNISIGSFYYKGKFNWTSGDDYTSFDGQTLLFNTSKLESTYYNATQSHVIRGTLDGGSLVNTQHPNGKYDSVTLNFSEETGSPALDLRVNFTGVPDFNEGVMRYKTSSLVGVYPTRQLWNYNTEAWDNQPSLALSEVFVFGTQPMFDSSRYLKDGVVQMRIYKASNGNTNNHYYVDWMALIDGIGVPAGEEIDPNSYHTDENIDADNYNATFSYVNATHYCNRTNCYTLGDFLTGGTGGTDSWSTNYTFYYNKTEVDNNFTLYYLKSIVNSMLASNLTLSKTYTNTNVNANLTTAKTYANLNIIGNLTSDSWSTNYTFYYNKTEVDNNLSNYILSINEGSLNVNSSDYWDNYNSVNTTQIENSAGVLNIKQSWLTIFWNAIWSTKTTDDLTEGAANKYDNQSWNETKSLELHYLKSETDNNLSLKVSKSGDTMTGNLTLNDNTVRIKDSANNISLYFENGCLVVEG